MNVQGIFMFAKLLAVFAIIVFGFVHIFQGLFDGCNMCMSLLCEASHLIASSPQPYLTASKPIIPSDPNAGNIGIKQIAHSIYSGLFAYGGW